MTHSHDHHDHSHDHHDHSHDHHNHSHDHHDHSHDHHDHHHDHSHPHEKKGMLSFEEKMIKLFNHWIKHNTDHAQTYQDWAAKAKENHLDDVDLLLKEVADMTLLINKKFEEAINMVKNKI